MSELIANKMATLQSQQERIVATGLDEKLALAAARKAVQAYLDACTKHGHAVYAVHGPDSPAAGPGIEAGLDFITKTCLEA